RPKARLDWGIELPFDKNFVTYVWYDAFWAYLSPLGKTDRESLSAILPVTEHFIGKDILKTHAVYWPAMLLAVELPLYRHLNVHGYLNYGGARLSKSSGNIVDPLELAAKYGPDVLRYFVLREFGYGLDGDFSEDRLIDRFNADLANDLGNLTSRVLSMVQRYFEGAITAAPTSIPSDLGVDTNDAGYFLDLTSLSHGEPRKHEKLSFDWRGEVDSSLNQLDFKGALDNIWDRVSRTNHYVVATSPFTLAKDPANMTRVAQILANLVEGLRVIAYTLDPFMPATSAKILDLLNVDQQMARQPFGKGIPAGHRVKPTTPLFPRIDKKARA
ncbi:MAG TPA: class I tRNA ligase family protein, partial [Candidatus Acidoferrales bacterium]|nr:class I tRNA ligase family protein [Candidatus Acidoferrales bacterium]